MKKRAKKRAVTLVEIMIVILLIGLIGGALAFNMRGSVDKGRSFKTEQNISRVYDALMLEYAKGEKSIDQIISNADSILSSSPMIKNPASVKKDAWGEELKIEPDGKGDISVYSVKIGKPVS